MSRTSRLFSLLQALRRRRQPVTAAVLATELEVSERTIYRDLAELAAQGAPIQGEAGIGYVLRPGLFLPPLMLTEDETDAILLGLRYVDQRGDETLIQSAENARAKIMAVLTSEMRDAASSPMTIPGPDGRTFPKDHVSIGLLRAAIRQQRKLEIDYVDGQDRKTHRTFWPVQLGFLDEARVVAGWCEMRSAFRFFRTDRILGAEMLDRFPARRSALVRALQAQLRDEQSAFKTSAHSSTSAE